VVPWETVPYSVGQILVYNYSTSHFHILVISQEVSSSHAQEAELRQSLTQSRTCMMELKSQVVEQQNEAESVSAHLQQAETALNCSREELAEAHRAKGALQMECEQLKVSNLIGSIMYRIVLSFCIFYSLYMF